MIHNSIIYYIFPLDFVERVGCPTAVREHTSGNRSCQSTAGVQPESVDFPPLHEVRA